MTGSLNDFHRTVIASSGAAAAIALEHLISSEIGNSIELSPEWEKRLSNFLGVSTICTAFLFASRDGDSRGGQVAKLGAITLAAGLSALGCSAVRETARLYRAGKLLNGRLAERARRARNGEDGGLEPWSRI